MHQKATPAKRGHHTVLNGGLGAAALALLLVGCPEDPATGGCVTRADCEVGERCLDGTCAPGLPRLDGGGRDAGGRDDDDGGLAADGGCAGAGCDDLPVPLWDTVMGSGVDGGFDSGRAVAVDGDGNVVVAGPFNGTLSALGDDHVSRGASDVFVAKFGPAGDLVWLQTFGSTLPDSCRGIAVDAAANIYLTGQYQGDGVTVVDSSALPYNTGDGKNIFVVSLAADGSHRWSHGYVGAGTDTGNDIAVQGNRVYVVGRFLQRVELPIAGVAAAGTGTGTEAADAFIVAYDLEGVAQWQHTYGGVGSDQAWGVVATDNNKAHLTGSFSGTVNFGLAPDTTWQRTAVGAQDLFVLKLSAVGEPRHLYTAGGVGASAVGRDVTVAPDRGLLVGGNFSGTVPFSDGGAPETATDTDGFLLRLDNTLSHRWHEVMGGAGPERVLNVAFGAGGQAFATGQFAGSATIAGESLTAVDLDDAFVAAFQEDGAGTSAAEGWVMALGNPGQDWGWGTAVVGDRLFISGAVRGDTDFGGGTPTPAMANGDIYVAAYRVR